MKKTKQEQQLIPNTQEETQDNIQPTEVTQENVAPQSKLPEINQETQDITPQTLEPQKQVITEQKTGERQQDGAMHTEPLMPEQLPNISPNVGGFDFSDEEDQEWEKGYNEDNLKMDTINTLMDKRGGLTRQEKATIKTFLPRAFNIAKRNSKDRGEALSKLYNLTTLDDDGLPRNLIEDPDETAQGARAVATNTLMNYANTVTVPQAMSHDVQLLGRYISQAVNSNDAITRRAAAKKAKDLTEKLKNAGIDDDETKSWIFLYEYRNPLEYAGHANLSDDDVIYVNRKFKGEPLLASMEPVDGWDTVKVGDLRKAAVAHMFGFNSSYKDKFTTGLFGKDEIPYKDIPNIDALNNPELWTDVDDFKKQRASKDGLYFASNWDRLETIAKNTGDMNKTLELLVGVLMADKKMTREQAEREAARIMKENQEKEAAHQAELNRIKAENEAKAQKAREDRQKEIKEQEKKSRIKKASTVLPSLKKGKENKIMQTIKNSDLENKGEIAKDLAILTSGEIDTLFQLQRAGHDLDRLFDSKGNLNMKDPWVKDILKQFPGLKDNRFRQNIVNFTRKHGKVLKKLGKFAGKIAGWAVKYDLVDSLFNVTDNTVGNFRGQQTYNYLTTPGEGRAVVETLYGDDAEDILKEIGSDDILPYLNWRFKNYGAAAKPVITRDIKGNPVYDVENLSDWTSSLSNADVQLIRNLLEPIKHKYTNKHNPKTGEVVTGGEILSTLGIDPAATKDELDLLYDNPYLLPIMKHKEFWRLSPDERYNIYYGYKKAFGDSQFKNYNF